MQLSRFLPHRLSSNYLLAYPPKFRLGRLFSSTKVLSIDGLDMETVNTTVRLEGLRRLMSENKIDVYSMIRRLFPYEKSNLIFVKLFPQKTVISLNTSHPAMPVEVRTLENRLGSIGSSY